MSQYNPKTVLRQTSNSLLKEFFESRSVELDVAWEELHETKIQAVFDALQRLPEEARQPIEIVLQEVHQIASSEEGILQLVRESSNDGFADKLEQFDSRYDKAIWAYMHEPATWDSAVRFHASDSLSKRYWYARQCPAVEPDCSEEAVLHLQNLLSIFFIEGQGRGHHCLVEHLRRNDGQDYFFVYLSNYAETYQTWDNSHVAVQRLLP